MSTNTAHPASRRPALLLTALCAAQVMLVLDLVVVTVALPSIRADLGIAPADLQWVVTTYGLAYGGFMITAGRAGDLFGHRRILVAGLVVFTVASALAGLATGPVTLFAARALQGVGGALVSPTALALLTTAFAEGEVRNRALGAWGAVGSAGATGAALVGGLLTDLVHWRAIFMINIPVGIVVILVVIRIVGGHRPDRTGRLDLAGAVLLTGGVVLLVAAVTRAAEGPTAAVWVMAGASAATLAAFAVVERRVAEPVVKASLLATPTVRYGNLICALSAAAALVTQYFTTLSLQNVAGMSPLETGLAFAPVTAIIVVVSGRAGALVARFGVRLMITAGAAATALGLLLLGLAPSGAVWTGALPGLLISGLGAGLMFAPSMIVSTSGVPDEDQGLASGLLNTSFQLGGPLGLAVLSAVAASVTGGATGGVTGGATGTQALTDGYRAAFLWSLALPALIVAAVAALPRDTAPEPAPAHPGSALE
ncbi:EmrB/QacA subfamily drug resistance transporter [Streptosporangium becharense]|uniref:EmrB/QacA subfamily drug resistance transporter n=1 Tax=Streptosporangium becharense TaxID=1816182 RepID=A0A7W9MH60_9ACTN|nr:MFS transporter [Streptosporangium becharense]MBB2908874.1 EmrB/QacA subfamily drug resistance transporter [Streptosporangium becharense]MBB5820108.1 EmrB/QacA subfamily drug resistance transporter [Streptosporangium becharense]